MNLRTTPTDVDEAFGWLIDPVSAATFFARHFEQDVLHVARGNAGYFGALYGVESVEDALVVGAGDPEHFALIKSDAFAQASMTTERSAIRFRATRQAARSLVDPRSVLAAFAQGYTLTIKDAGAYHPPLARLCNRIQAQLGFYVHANAYFTPPGAQGFGIHYDTHDTLIVQIDGTKDWSVHDPAVVLPLETMRFTPDAHVGKLETPRAIHLQAGDSLYIPRGFPHEAKTSDARSLHLTFAIAPIRAVDLLDALVQLAAAGDVGLRRALPPGWHRDPAFAPGFSARLGELLPRAFASERVPLAADSVYNEVFAATRTTAAGIFDDLAALERLHADSRIRLRDDAPFHVRERADRLHIVIAGKVVSVEAAARGILDRLASGSATFAEIERQLTPTSARGLVRTLVLEGLATIEDADPLRSATT